jgi:hypothetical protein
VALRCGARALWCTMWRSRCGAKTARITKIFASARAVALALFVCFLSFFGALFRFTLLFRYSKAIISSFSLNEFCLPCFAENAVNMKKEKKEKGLKTPRNAPMPVEILPRLVDFVLHNKNILLEANTDRVADGNRKRSQLWVSFAASMNADFPTFKAEPDAYRKRWNTELGKVRARISEIKKDCSATGWFIFLFWSSNLLAGIKTNFSLILFKIVIK